MYGELVPVGGGDPIPLLKTSLLLGRRESCDIVLRFSNVSAHHCQLTVNGGYWYVRDLNSRNGVKVNGLRVADTEQRLDPGDVLCGGKACVRDPVFAGGPGRGGPAAARRDRIRRSSARACWSGPGCKAAARSSRPPPEVAIEYDEPTRYDLSNDWRARSGSERSATTRSSRFVPSPFVRGAGVARGNTSEPPSPQPLPERGDRAVSDSP